MGAEGKFQAKGINCFMKSTPEAPNSEKLNWKAML
jgi:hypothetical protein